MDILRIKKSQLVLNSPSTATQQMLGAIAEKLKQIRSFEATDVAPSDLSAAVGIVRNALRQSWCRLIGRCQNQSVIFLETRD